MFFQKEFWMKDGKSYCVLLQLYSSWKTARDWLYCKKWIITIIRAYIFLHPRINWIGVFTDTVWPITNISTYCEVSSKCRGLLRPAERTAWEWKIMKRLSMNVLGHGIGPSLSHPSRFRALQATCSSATSHAISNAMGHFMDNDGVIQITIAHGLLALISERTFES